MNNGVLLSLIIPVYNVQNYITECAQSILAQPLVNCEVIFVDDGSRDNSIQVLNHYLQDFPEVNWRVLHKPNGGLSSARNFGLHAASGKYVWFVDSDDCLAIGAVQRLKQLIDEYDSPDSIFFDFMRFTDTIPEATGIDAHPTLSTGQDILSEIFQRNRDNYAWSFITKRSVYEANQIVFPEGRNYEDMATTYRVAYFSRRVVSLSEDLYYYRDRPGSISNEGASKNATDLYLNIEDCMAFFKNHESPIFDRFFANFAAYFSLLAYQQRFDAETWQRTKTVIAHVGFSALSAKYKIAYILAKLRLLKLAQAFRKHAKHS
ncbi:glycosyltransferase [Lacticaseibacillus sp. GG6-2]